MFRNRVSVNELTRHQFTPAELSECAFEFYSNSDEVFYTNSEGVFYVADNSLASYAYLVGEDLSKVEEYLQWAAEGFFEDPDFDEQQRIAAEEFEDD